MPELPEVETVRRTLLASVKGKRITAVTVMYERVIANTDLETLRAKVQGASVVGIERRGKYLAIKLNNRGFIVVHLRMTGRLVVSQGGTAEKHLHIVFHLHDGTAIRFVDQRKFGRVYWAENKEELAQIAHVGVEPLSAAFTPDAFHAMLQKSDARIKAFLLDQKRLAGLGNIYVDESLFRAGIHPSRRASTLSREEAHQLWQGIRDSLTAGIEHGGTTLRDYVDGTGKQGENQFFLQAYGRAGEPCLRCGQEMVRTKVAGRGTVFCPDCQPEPGKARKPQ